MRNAYELFTDAAKIFKSDEPVYSKTFYGLLVLLGAAARIVVSFSRNATPEERGAIKGQIMQAWHEQVSTIDLPMVGVALEALLDNAIETGLSAGFDVLAAKIDSLNADITKLLEKAK